MIITPEDIKKLIGEKTAEIKMLEEQRELLEQLEREVKIEVSDHALVRYMERVQKLDLKSRREEIRKSCIHIGLMNLKTGHRDLKDISVLRNGYKLVIKDNTVVTVMDR